MRSHESGGGRICGCKMKHKKRVIIISIIILAIIASILFRNFYATGKSIQQIEIIPLSSAEITKVQNVLVSSELIKDVPDNEPIALRFFSFENGKRIWRDGFLIGNNQLLTSGVPSIQLILHSKYIEEFNANNICDIVRKAKQNGDLGFYSEHNKASLLWKYKSMLKHRGCFGF